MKMEMAMLSSDQIGSPASINHWSCVTFQGNSEIWSHNTDDPLIQV